MKTKLILSKIILFSLLFAAYTVKAQISHGGKPLPYITLKAISADFFQEMPPFDIEEEKRIDSLNQNDLKGGFRFAYKFITDFTPANSGSSFVLADGTKVWRLGIRSANAYSLNIVFSEYELPEGASLFLYTPDQTQILGSFTHQNNSELGLLPVAPIHGEELIIEYQEPAGVDFSGRLRIGEVNHGYRDFRGVEPGTDLLQYACMPSPVCISDTTDKFDKISRSVVLLIINGEVLCSGVLVNNTRNDGTPYLLTASHCLNKQFTVQNPDYAQVAGSIVAFFNYDSPFCTSVLRGAEELSMASAKYRAVNEKTDMALLELLEIPPIYYRPYYAGWNVAESSSPPYSNIHHPGGAVKRINSCVNEIKLVSYSEKSYDPYGFNAKSHWFLELWETGCTAGGSSGSPLFDRNNRIVGALTGGQSTCSSPKNDLFFALHQSWTSGNADSTNLKPWLSPNTNNQLQCDGFDPYETNNAVELSNVQSSGNREGAAVLYLSAPQEGHQFGVNTLQTVEYAEAFAINGEATLYGAYFVTPEIKNVTGLNVEVKVYNGTPMNAPSDVLYTTSFSPTYTNKRILDNEFQETIKPLSRAQESFIKFENPVSVSDNFFVGYKITALEKDSFTVYALPSNGTQKNTAWINSQNQWIENSSHPVNPFKSSLFINPVIQHKTPPVNNTYIENFNVRLLVDRSERKVEIIVPREIVNLNYQVCSIDGKIVQKGTIQGNYKIILLPKNGVYIFHLFMGNKKYISKVVV